MENNKETLNRDAFKQIVKEIVKEEIDKGNLDEETSDVVLKVLSHPIANLPHSMPLKPV